MNSTPIIICAPEFENRLKLAYPRGSVISYSETIDLCQARVSALDEQKLREVILLFKGLQNPSSNQPVKDHLNLSKLNPLIGPADVSKGPRFPDMSSVYKAKDGMIVVVGEDEDLTNFKEPWVQVTGGVWEAIALKHRGYSIEGWIIVDLEKWINECPIFN